MSRTLESHNLTLADGHLKATKSFQTPGHWGRKGIKWGMISVLLLGLLCQSHSFIQSVFFIEGLPCDRHSRAENKTDEVPAFMGIVS